MSASVDCLVDETHCGRHVTGIERITLELFSAQALAPLRVYPVRSANRKKMVLDQLMRLPILAAQHKNALVLCSGFPPTPPLAFLGERVIPYIHDLFLLTRPSELNWRARAYMAPSLRFALNRLTRFMVNSEFTASELRRFCRNDADIRLYRPAVRNVLGVAMGDPIRPSHTGELRLLALGTVEPRKNLAAAADIVAALRAKGFTQARLDIVGREGWGGAADQLKGRAGVTLHGYAPIETIRSLAADADFFISTSHAEGLGLPLLEIQYAGLPVIAPDQPVFHEVLRDSGLLIDTNDAASAASQMIAMTKQPDWRSAAQQAASANLRRWNAQADADHAAIIRWLSSMIKNQKR
ncbi:MAG: glycosyltransferase [Beijerinckiaceae bacterium]